jgi:hypothetical protein
VFGVNRGKVLGCLVSVKGIEANQVKIKAIVCMKSPKSGKEVQILTGRAKLVLFQSVKRLQLL